MARVRAEEFRDGSVHRGSGFLKSRYGVFLLVSVSGGASPAVRRRVLSRSTLRETKALTGGVTAP